MHPRHLLQLVILSTILAAAAPASAVKLWDKVESGMTLDQLRSLYPGLARTLPRDTYVLGQIEQFQNCPARVAVLLVNGKVSLVELTGQPEVLPTCLRGIEKSLTQQFGKPRRLGILREWTHDGVSWLLNPRGRRTIENGPGPLDEQWSLQLYAAGD